MKKSMTQTISKYLLVATLTVGAMTTQATPALALEYTESDQSAGVFATATSVEPIITVGGEDIFTANLSKNVAVTPPPFGYGNMTVTQTPSTPTTTSTPPTTVAPDVGGTTTAPSIGYTPVTSDMYTSRGTLGTVYAPAIGLSVPIYEGTDSTPLSKGAGHFIGTSIWNGNVALAGHNRGVTNHFGKIHTLDVGDTIKLYTTLGTRVYEVYSVRKVSVNDTSILYPSSDNIITLVTCVMNQPDYRWCVQAIQR